MPRRTAQDPLLVTFGRRIVALRQEKRLTQRALSKKSQISASHLSGIEHGRVMVGLRMLNSLARGLGVKLLDVVTFPEEDRRQRFLDGLRRGNPEIITVENEIERLVGQPLH